MIWRWSYLNKLQNIVYNNKTYNVFFNLFYFKSVVYLNKSKKDYIKLNRPRLLNKKHKNQYIYYNTIFYYWLTDYKHTNSYFKSLFFINFSTINYIILPSQIIINFLNNQFYNYKILSISYKPYITLIPKTSLTFNELMLFFNKIFNISPLLFHISFIKYVSIINLFVSTLNYYIINFIFYNIYLIYIKQIYAITILLYLNVNKICFFQKKK